MADYPQSLRDILKQASDVIRGAPKLTPAKPQPGTKGGVGWDSKTGPGSTGTDPGVDYKPKAGDEDEFVAKHSTQRWDHRDDNPVDFATKGVKYSLDTPQNSRMGNNETQSKAAEFVPAREETEVNEGGWERSGSHEKDNRDDRNDEAYKKWKKAMAKKPAKKPAPVKEAELPCNHTKAGVACEKHGKTLCPGTKTAAEKQMSKLKEGTLSVIKAVIAEKADASATIHDFVHSDNKMFDGDSKKQRIHRALGAYYAKQNEDLDEGKKKPVLRDDPSSGKVPNTLPDQQIDSAAGANV